MIDKIRFYLGNDKAREKISSAGQARVLRDHVYEVRIRRMCSIIDETGILLA
jgi:spore maturation protein CgeB